MRIEVEQPIDSRFLALFVHLPESADLGCRDQLLNSISEEVFDLIRCSTRDLLLISTHTDLQRRYRAEPPHRG